MSPRRGQPADIQTKVIKVFDDQSVEFDRGGGSELRVIAWIVNGSEKAPQLERREWWMTEDGTRRPGKAKGLTVQDFAFVVKNAREIAQAMGMPAKLIEEALVGNTGNTEEKTAQAEAQAEAVEADGSEW